MQILDEIRMPSQERFHNAEEYFSTLFHEMIHSTGHETRLNRFTDGTQFGDDEYGKEELIAEMGSAFLCGMTGINKQVEENSAAYLQGWIKILKGDPKLIIQAASQAQKAVDLIIGKTFENDPKPATSQPSVQTVKTIKPATSEPARQLSLF